MCKPNLPANPTRGHRVGIASISGLFCGVGERQKIAVSAVAPTDRQTDRQMPAEKPRAHQPHTHTRRELEMHAARST